jgi:CubicO group peptidase (beta-lactamase class C family)
MKIAAMLFILLLIVVLLGVLYAKYRLDNTPDKKNLETTIEAEVDKAMRGGLFPGLVVGIYKDGVVFIKGYGTVNKEAAKIPDATTAFQIGSISKVFTASLLQSLSDEGVVAMDATLGELIGSSIALSPSVQSVTLRQLATHTSGFPRIPKSIGAKVTNMAGDADPLLNPYSYLEPQAVFEYLASAEDMGEPGRLEYSNFGMGLLGHVLEMVAGEPYEKLVAEKVLGPLGMDNTAITPTPEIQERLAQAYNAKGAPTGVWTFASLAGAGAFYSNAEDMMKFIQANLEQSGAAGQSFRKMREPQFKGDTGIGWLQPGFLDRFFGNRDVVWHNGMVGGYASYMSIDITTRTGVVVLTNQANSVDMLGMMLTRQVRKQSWANHSQ